MRLSELYTPEENQALQLAGQKNTLTLGKKIHQIVHIVTHVYRDVADLSRRPYPNGT